jgi:hypothetical protein
MMTAADVMVTACCMNWNSALRAAFLSAKAFFLFT